VEEHALKDAPRCRLPGSAVAGAVQGAGGIEARGLTVRYERRPGASALSDLSFRACIRRAGGRLVGPVGSARPTRPALGPHGCGGPARALLRSHWCRRHRTWRSMTFRRLVALVAQERLSVHPPPWPTTCVTAIQTADLERVGISMARGEGAGRRHPRLPGRYQTLGRRTGITLSGRQRQRGRPRPPLMVDAPLPGARRCPGGAWTTNTRPPRFLSSIPVNNATARFP